MQRRSTPVKVDGGDAYTHLFHLQPRCRQLRFVAAAINGRRRAQLRRLEVQKDLAAK